MKPSNREINEYLHMCFIKNRPTIGEVKKYMQENGCTQPIPEKLAYHIALGLATRKGIMINGTTTLHSDIYASWYKAYIQKATKMLETTEYDHMLPLEFFKLFIDEIGVPIPYRIVRYWNSKGLDLNIALAKIKPRRELEVLSSDILYVPNDDIPSSQWIQQLVLQLNKEGKATRQGTIEPSVLKTEIEARYYRLQGKTPPDKWWDKIFNRTPDNRG